MGARAVQRYQPGAGPHFTADRIGEVTPDALAAALRTIVAEVVSARGGDAWLVPDTVGLERPKNRDHGDWASNIALALAKPLGVNPRDLAAQLAERILNLDGVKAVDVAGPGFI